MKQYDHKKVEKKWQGLWEKKQLHVVDDASVKPKFYALMEFPFPSGDGLHVGHVRGNVAMDVVARKRRAEGYNVLFPTGWDAFGLPTENAAIKNKVSPQKISKRNTTNFKKQMKRLGLSFDWTREINTTDPAYYKWTQWLFLQFYKHGLAYKAKMTINWCPKDKIGLANEEVVNGFCERCGTAVEKRDKEQWMLAITKYADRLAKDLDLTEFPEHIKTQQRHWIAGLRDWVFSRQRYWGEPIPMVHCEACGWVPVPEQELPVTLPRVKKYEPTDTGESPLAAISSWVQTTCPTCGGKAQRETDTMPNWAGSSWYFLRFIDPKNTNTFADTGKLERWMPVDWYNGGMEHTTLHLLYSRFWNKFLFDCGLVPTTEPYKRRTSHGMILGPDGEKMSKSRGNVINPDEVIMHVGADTLRVYEMFIGPFDQAVSWSTDSIAGSRRFLERVWRLQEHVSKDNISVSDALNGSVAKAIKKVSDDIERAAFNTAISALMILTNEFEKEIGEGKNISRMQYETLLQLLAPFAPHITNELWSLLGNKTPLAFAPWPQAQGGAFESQTKMIAVQVNGKVRAEVEVAKTETEEEIRAKTLALPAVSKWLEGKQVVKVIYVKDRLVNIVLQ